MDINVAVLGLRECINRLDKAGRVDITQPILKGTLKVKRKAKELVRVDTGYLRNSIQHRLEKKESVEGVVYTNVEYGLFQEYGTRYQKGKPFLRPAIKRLRNEIVNDLEQYITQRLKNV